MSTNELNATAKELLSVRAMIAELEAEAEHLTDKLKAAMVERGTEALQGDGWKASWKNVVSSRFDSKKFIRRLGCTDLFLQFTDLFGIFFPLRIFLPSVSADNTELIADLICHDRGDHLQSPGFIVV